MIDFRLSLFWGSSPRVRGEVTHHLLSFCRDGIIPAGAGRRRFYEARFGEGWDHPRGCGEKCVRNATQACVAGSSPRVRGEGNNKEA